MQINFQCINIRSTSFFSSSVCWDASSATLNIPLLRASSVTKQPDFSMDRKFGICRSKQPHKNVMEFSRMHYNYTYNIYIFNIVVLFLSLCSNWEKNHFIYLVEKLFFLSLPNSLHNKYVRYTALQLINIMYSMLYQPH